MIDSATRKLSEEQRQLNDFIYEMALCNQKKTDPLQRRIRRLHDKIEVKIQMSK